MSLIEFLMAITLLMVGLLAIAGLMSNAARHVALAGALDRSSMEIEVFVDSARWSRLSGSGHSDRGGARLHWQFGSEEGDLAWVRYEHHDLTEPITVHFIRGWSP